MGDKLKITADQRRVLQSGRKAERRGRKAEGRVGKMIYMRPEAWCALDNQQVNISDTRGKVVARLIGVPDPKDTQRKKQP